MRRYKYIMYKAPFVALLSRYAALFHSGVIVPYICLCDIIDIST